MPLEWRKTALINIRYCGSHTDMADYISDGSLLRMHGKDEIIKIDRSIVNTDDDIFKSVS